MDLHRQPENEHNSRIPTSSYLGSFTTPAIDICTSVAVFTHCQLYVANDITSATSPRPILQSLCQLDVQPHPPIKLKGIPRNREGAKLLALYVSFILYCVQKLMYCRSLSRLNIFSYSNLFDIEEDDFEYEQDISRSLHGHNAATIGYSFIISMILSTHGGCLYSIVSTC